MGLPRRLARANGARHRQHRSRARQDLSGQAEGRTHSGGIDADGAQTTNPGKAIEGIVLPMAQHKGYAIAAMMDMLSGVLTGSGFGAQVTGPYQAQRRRRAGHFMLAVNIETLQPLAEFNARIDARIDALIAELKSVPLAQGFDEVFYPGEIEAHNDAKNRADGVLLPADTVADLRKLADEYGLKSLLPVTWR